MSFLSIGDRECISPQSYAPTSLYACFNRTWLWATSTPPAELFDMSFSAARCMPALYETINNSTLTNCYTLYSGTCYTKGSTAVSSKGFPYGAFFKATRYRKKRGRWNGLQNVPDQIRPDTLHNIPWCNSCILKYALLIFQFRLATAHAYQTLEVRSVYGTLYPRLLKVMT